VSGGGRCNLTNSFAEVVDLSHVYPRGHRQMKRWLCEFSHTDAFDWFESHGVALVTQEDQCVFPKVQDSAAVINCLTEHARRLGVKVCLKHAVQCVVRTETDQLQIQFQGAQPAALCDKVAVTIGGTPRSEAHDWLSALGHRMESPCPSLYTFAIKHSALNNLMGIVVDHVQVGIAGTKFRADGTLLITHWGVSGPAVLRLSSYAARHLSDQNFRAPLVVSWAGDRTTEEVVETLQYLSVEHARKQLGSIRPYGLQTRLWQYLLQRAELPDTRTWAELGKKALNKLATILTADTYEIEGKGTWKEEFVTCGGVSLKSISTKTLESKCCPGLYFAGEVLDVDAVTGGFNLQAAWTMAYVAAQGICRDCE
jgi:predicted Rossmann fold flavoprotein